MRSVDCNHLNIAYPDNDPPVCTDCCEYLTDSECSELIQSLQAEIAELKAGREGMVLVPKAPTETMLLAGANCQRSLDVIASKKLRANNIYLHMLKAHNGGEG